ncbi:AMP-binding protein [Bordetella bronchialis]|uniref:Long-chain acyl-CoA synthetase n=1 Tax=Bordetella bronchialis TaxID=463025 RepID=A0ABM6CT16_9BORD|nr:AMP-binding protein [Bordetella bronchialis]ANN67209.1 long-chain acyl-CoA synthetase [Bordetella bronchialis]
MNVPAFFERLREAGRAGRTALDTPEGPVSYAELDGLVARHADRLAALDTRAVASLMDNGADWIVHDLACLRAGVVHLPLPLFFTPAQIRAALGAGGVGALVTGAGPGAAFPDLDGDPGEPWSPTLRLHRLRAPATALHPGTAKITFTSGSTGDPKGVCLGAAEMLDVAASLASATGPLAIERHLAALPLPVLLENIAGVYAPLLQGAAVAVRPLGQVGLQGSSRFDPAVFHAALEQSGANSVIALPQMLRAYAGWLAATGVRAPSALRFMAVGGAAVGAALLTQARALGLPAYEGYGLSEACSVQALNLPGADIPGSAGRPLPHARLRVAPDGEIEIAGTHALGYLGQPALARTWLPTGDLGHLDDAGFLHIDGRKKNVLVTGFGRNVSPEWVELHLAGQPGIAHAVVLGDGQPALGAVLWPLPGTDEAAMHRAVERVNEILPDYARVGSWSRARAEFSPASGMATANGRPRRDAIAALHADLFLSIHQPPLP